jgi:hypothetical protein
MELSIPVGTTIAVTVALTAALTTGAFFAGRTSAPSDVEQVSALVAAQAVQLDIVLDGVADLAAAAGAPVVLDAEVRAALARVPPSCVVSLGGDPMAPQCMLLSCWAMGQSAAQRPSCEAAEQAVTRSFQNGTESSEE